MALVIAPHAPKLHGIDHRVIDPGAGPLLREFAGVPGHVRRAELGLALRARAPRPGGDRPRGAATPGCGSPGPKRPPSRASACDHIGDAGTGSRWSRPARSPAPRLRMPSCDHPVPGDCPACSRRRTSGSGRCSRSAHRGGRVRPAGRSHGSDQLPSYVLARVPLSEPVRRGCAERAPEPPPPERARCPKQTSHRCDAMRRRRRGRRRRPLRRAGCPARAAPSSGWSTWSRGRPQDAVLVAALRWRGARRGRDRLRGATAASPQVRGDG